MYSCNTMPDYYNRLSLFLAKMIHDGNYDAHEMINGSLVYTPEKDERFSYYFQERDKYKDSKGRYKAAESDKKFNEQRNKYLLLMGEFHI